jgi:Ni2+-binding GTPase involved in maturation of urease and hydrogenase
LAELKSSTLPAVGKKKAHAQARMVAAAAVKEQQQQKESSGSSLVESASNLLVPSSFYPFLIPIMRI